MSRLNLSKYLMGNTCGGDNSGSCRPARQELPAHNGGVVLQLWQLDCTFPPRFDDGGKGSRGMSRRHDLESLTVTRTSSEKCRCSEINQFDFKTLDCVRYGGTVRIEKRMQTDTDSKREDIQPQKVVSD
ncbi:hypothetical protein BaRGS_00013043 [Batillaria attramentaria]|uniref:Uncharacterized protein n=1 Tax=Batillaria attramentaria TaxID=370345 RepID=A0ABD0L7S6_9CAEN